MFAGGTDACVWESWKKELQAELYTHVVRAWSYLKFRRGAFKALFFNPCCLYDTLLFFLWFFQQQVDKDCEFRICVKPLYPWACEELWDLSCKYSPKGEKSLGETLHLQQWSVTVEMDSRYWAVIIGKQESFPGQWEPWVCDLNNLKELEGFTALSNFVSLSQALPKGHNADNGNCGMHRVEILSA